MDITLAFKKGLQLIYHTTIRRRGCCLAEFAFILCLSKQYIVCTVWLYLYKIQTGNKDDIQLLQS